MDVHPPTTVRTIRIWHGLERVFCIFAARTGAASHCARGRRIARREHADRLQPVRAWRARTHADQQLDQNRPLSLGNIPAPRPSAVTAAIVGSHASQAQALVAEDRDNFELAAERLDVA